MDRFELRCCVIWELADREEGDDVDTDVVNGRPASLLFQKRRINDQGHEDHEECDSWLGRTDDGEYYWDMVEDQSICIRKRRNVYLLENVWRKGKAHQEKILVIVPDEDNGDGDSSIAHDNKAGIVMLERIYAEQGLFQNKENELPTALSANGILEEGTIEALEEEEEEGERSLVATGIAKAGEMVAAGILKSAEVASAVISRGGSFIESHIQPREESLEVPVEVKSGISKAKTFSKSVSDVSAEIVSTVGELASELAVNLSRGIENRNNEGDEVEAAAPATSNKHSQVLKTAKDVAAAALVAAGSITLAATQGARKVCSSTAEATSAIAKARHGESVGEAVDDALCTAGYALDTAIAARSMSIKATSRAVITKAMAGSDSSNDKMSDSETTTNSHTVIIEEEEDDKDGHGGGDDENPSLPVSTSRLLLLDQLPDPPPPDE